MKVLVVEDDELVSRGLMRLLRLMAHEPVSTRSAVVAQRLLEADPSFSAMIVDLGLQNGESGQELIAWARRHRPVIQRIAMSGASKRPRGILENGPYERFLRKPLGRKDLAPILDAPPK